MPIIPSLNLDDRPLNKENKSLVYAKNIVVDKGLKSIKNEDGFLLKYTANKSIIGIIEVGTKLVVFSTNNTLSEIGIYDNDGNLVIIGKLSEPVALAAGQTISLELSLDF